MPGEYAGFDSESASIQRSKDIERWAAERENVLVRGLTPDIVDKNSTPDLFRVREAIKARINWPKPFRADELLKMYSDNTDWPVAVNMIAYGYGVGPDARLVVLRPYWEKEKDIEWGVASKTTGIPWELGSAHNKTILKDVGLGEINGVISLTKALTEGVIKLKDRHSDETLSIPPNPLVFFQTSGHLARENIIPAVRSKLGV